MKEYLFSYGTIQRDAVQVELFGRLLSGTKDVLQGYHLSSILLREEAFAAEPSYLIASPSTNPNDCIEGMVFEITSEEILLADRYEPKEYKRELVQLASGKTAWIYVAADH